jgi:hypothetical protein
MMYVMSSIQPLGTTTEPWVQRHPVLTTVLGAIFWMGVFTALAKLRVFQRNPEQLGLWSPRQERALGRPGPKFIVKRRKPLERSTGGRFRWSKWEKRGEHDTLDAALAKAKDYSKHPWRWRYAVFYRGKQVSDYDVLRPRYRYLRSG